MIRNKIFIFIAAIIIFSPLLLGILGIKPVNTNENRELAKKPVLSFDKIKGQKRKQGKLLNSYREIVRYKNAYNDYYSDNFPLRTVFFKPYHYIKSQILDIDPLPHKVVEGKDGWMFLGDSHSDVIRESLALSVFTKQQLSRIKRNISNDRDFFKSQGIKFYLAIAPNKHSYYRDKLISVEPKRKTKLQQLKHVLRSSNIEIIDLAEGFKKEKEQLFFKTNSHWNDYGAFLGYQNMMKVLKKDFQELNILTLDDISIQADTIYVNDLTRLLSVKQGEETNTFNLKEESSIELESRLPIPKNYIRSHKLFELRFKSDTNKFKIMVFRDSFSTRMIPFLSECFGESVFIWHNKMNKEIILREKPDIVIREIVERNIDNLLNHSIKK